MTTTSDSIRVLKYNKWSSFISNFTSDLFNDNIFRPKKFLFRGQGSVDYKLKSSFDRKFSSLPVTERVKKYKRMTTSYTNSFSKFFTYNATETDAISVAQHYGFPTRLLDWSSNPMVAAYFAFSGAAMDDRKKGRVAIWTIAMESPLVDPDLGLSILFSENRENSRANSQSGLFTHLTGSFDSIEDFCNHHDDCTYSTLIRFDIPLSEASVALSYLRETGISGATLFPDEYGMALECIEGEWLQSFM